MGGIKYISRIHQPFPTRSFLTSIKKAYYWKVKLFIIKMDTNYLTTIKINCDSKKIWNYWTVYVKLKWKNTIRKFSLILEMMHIKSRIRSIIQKWEKFDCSYAVTVIWLFKYSKHKHKMRWLFAEKSPFLNIKVIPNLNNSIPDRRAQS